MSLRWDPMNDGWQIVYESASRHACSERGLVLHSVGIPYDVVGDGTRCMLVVPDAQAEKAKFELWEYQQENRPRPRPAPRFELQQHNPVPGVIAYILVICFVAWLAGEAVFNRNWLAAGRVDGVLIRNGEWWRTITALTLHSGLKHLAGNLVFGVGFGLAAGRLVGSGAAWLTIVIASSVANFLNTLLLVSSHKAIGASTAVFAALGLVSGFVWKARLMAQDRWTYRLGPIIAGIALLAYTGTGDENTDIGAHLAGFACGFGGGLLLVYLYRWLDSDKVQGLAGVATIAIIALAWFAGLGD